MDTMETYKIRVSIQDAIRILDSAPLHRDLVYERNAAQLTNRAPIAHLAIERGLKSLLYRAGETQAQIRILGHSLNKLYRALEECDEESAAFLEMAFQDAIAFFRYNVNIKGFGHFRSLYDYLSKVGTDKYFEAMRYWVIEDSGTGDGPFQFICSRTHRELLCALHCLFKPTQETLSERVEHEIQRALVHRPDFVWGSEDTEKKNSIARYYEWLNSHGSYRSALEEAAAQNFAIDADSDFANQVIRAAYEELQHSEDPAVLYYISTLSYIARGSQRSGTDPKVEWIDKSKRRGEVVTSAGTSLGFLEWYPNGAWGIEPFESGLAGVKAIAWSHVDAEHFLVNRLTRLVIVTVNEASKSVRLVTMGDRIGSSATWTRDVDVDALGKDYNLEFWSHEHGLQVGNECNIEIPSDHSPGIVTVLKGVVTAVSEQKVVILGSTVIDLVRKVDR